MAASTSREPQRLNLPPDSVQKSKQSRKGKGKEQNVLPPNVLSESPESVVNSPWPWTSLTDSLASKHPPIFTKDGSYFFSIVRSSVKIHSVATGQVVSTLYAPSHQHMVSSAPPLDDITSATLNPHNVFQLITGSLNGCIMVWDFLDGVLLQTIDINQPIHHICAHEKFKDLVFVAASRRTAKISADGDNSMVLRVSLKPRKATAQSRVFKSSEIIAIGKTKSTFGLACSPSGAWLVAIAGHKAYVAMTSSLTSGFTKFVSPERLVCLAFHPSEEYFATGDDKGNIRLWYCLNEHIPTNVTGVEKKAQTTTWHWHAHAVSSIAFTANGAYLLSGGEEAVLVIWQLHTGKKEFVPRVGAPIQTVASCKVGDQEEYLLGLADATYTFVSASNLKISRSYSRLKLDPLSHLAPAFAPLAVHSSTSTLILPSSHPSSLQVYSPSSSKLISELEVSPSNRVSRRDEKPLEPARVEHIAISSSGEWMATIDGREADDNSQGEIYLKLWWWDRKTRHWILNTRIDRPHGLKKVSAIAFSPEISGGCSLNLVTTGQDENVKTWKIRRVKNKDGHSEEFWVSRSTFSFRSEIPTYASWSPDGSLLAIVLGPYLALYDTASNVLRQSLTFPGCKTLNRAHFVGRGGRYLVIIGAKDLILWDLVRRGARWHYNTLSLLEAVVVPHPSEDSFALFHPPMSPDHHTQISVFQVRSSSPHRTHTIPFKLLNIIWYPLSQSCSSNLSSFSLVGITQMWSVVLVGDDARSPQQLGSSTPAMVGDHLSQKKTLFQDIFGKSAFTGISDDALSSDSPVSGAYSRPRMDKEAAGSFDSPTYLIPRLESLFDPLIGKFLKERTNADAQTATRFVDPQHGEDEDVDMEDEVDKPPPVVPWTTRVPSQDEMAIFVDLFKKHVGSSNPPAPPNRKNTDSVPTPRLNGMAVHAPTPVSNGLTPKLKMSVKTLGNTSTAPSPPTTPDIKSNKGKRKKAS